MHDEVDLEHQHGVIMERITMVEFRRNASSALRKVMQGQSILLTYRGKPVVRLEPVATDQVREDDPIYGLAARAEPGGESMTNEQIDEAVYGP
jgi:prevent-host-death family protein